MLLYVPLSVGEYSTEVRTFAPVAPGDTDAGDVAWCRAMRDSVRAIMGSVHAGDTASFLELDTETREKRAVELSIAQVSKLKRLRGGLLCAVDGSDLGSADVIDINGKSKASAKAVPSGAKAKAKSGTKRKIKRD